MAGFVKEQIRLVCSQEIEHCSAWLAEQLRRRDASDGDAPQSIAVSDRAVRLAAPPGGATQHGGRIFLKVYQGSWLIRVRSLGRASIGAREYRGLEILRTTVGNPVQALAWGERRRAGLCDLSMIVTREWPGAIDLRRFTREWLAGERSEAERRRVAAAAPHLLARLRRLHDAGWFLRDSYDKNILYNPGFVPEHALAWIDQPRLRSVGEPLSCRRRAWDLACLDKGTAHGLLTRSERATAYLGYVGRKENALLEEDRRMLRSIARVRSHLERRTFLSRAFRSKALRRALSRTAAARG